MKPYADEARSDDIRVIDQFVVSIAISDELLTDAARLAESRSLRAYDAVQLASALAARSAAEDVDTFACYDDTLIHAAVDEGFEALSSAPSD